MSCNFLHSAAQHACRAALDKKGKEVILLDLTRLNAFADYFVIVTSGSQPQARAICQAVEDALDSFSLPRKRIEGYPQSSWIVQDYQGLVIHVFSREERDYYNLEKRWSEAGCERFKDEHPTHVESGRK